MSIYLHLCICDMFMQLPAEDVGFPEIEGTDSCEPPCGYWEWSIGLLQGLQICQPLCHLSGYPWLSFMGCLRQT